MTPTACMRRRHALALLLAAALGSMSVLAQTAGQTLTLADGRTVTLLQVEHSQLAGAGAARPRGLMRVVYPTAFAPDPFDRNPALLREVDAVMAALQPPAQARGDAVIWVLPRSNGVHKPYAFNRGADGRWRPQIDQHGRR